MAYTYSTEKYRQGVRAVMHKIKQPLRSREGFTITELMIAIAVLSVLIAIAVPSFRDAIEKQSVLSKSKQLRSALAEARDHAISKGTTVVVCGSVDQASCNTGSESWSLGWLSFIDENEDDDLNTGEVVLKAAPAFQDNTVLTVNDEPVVFTADGAQETTTPIEFVLCPASNKATHAKAVVVQVSGIIRYSRDTDNDKVDEYSYAAGTHSSGDPLKCPSS